MVNRCRTRNESRVIREYVDGTAPTTLRGFFSARANGKHAVINQMLELSSLHKVNVIFQFAAVLYMCTYNIHVLRRIEKYVSL